MSIAESREKNKRKEQTNSEKEKNLCCSCSYCKNCNFCNCDKCQCRCCNFILNKCQNENDKCELCDKIKNCFKCLFKENGPKLILINLTFKLILGCVYAGIIIGNLPSSNDFVDKGSFWEPEKDKMKKMSNQDESLAIMELCLCILFGCGGYICMYFGFPLLGILLLILPDIICGDLAANISIPLHRKTVINNLTNYSNQELINILYDSYNKIYSVQWIIFSIKMVLLFISIINLFCLK